MNDSDVRNQRVMAYLRSVYGQDPLPLRCYLESREVVELLRIGQQAGCLSIVRDLNIGGYSGKWRRAVEHQIRDGLDPQTWEFWHRARKAFLESGGCYRADQEPPKGE